MPHWISWPEHIRRHERGQIVVEYVLLLIVAVTVAILITTTMVSRSPERPGFLVQKWSQILQMIGQDQADDVQSSE